MIEPVSETVTSLGELMKKLNEVVGVLNETSKESSKKDVVIDQLKLKVILFRSKIP